MGLICKMSVLLQIGVLVLIGVQGELFPSHLWDKIQKFEIHEQYNYDALLAAGGVSEEKRLKEVNLKPTLEISENGKHGKLRVLGLSRDSEINFIFGEEFDEETPYGSKCHSKVLVKGETWIHKKVCEKYNIEIFRVFKSDKLIVTYKIGDVVATQIFHKV